MRLDVLQFQPGRSGEGVEGTDLIERIGSDFSRSETPLSRRPKPTRSGNPGCAPTPRPSAFARVTVRSIDCGSPPWNPQATFTEVAEAITASSSPTVNAPKLSPASQLISTMCLGMVKVEG